MNEKKISNTGIKKDSNVKKDTVTKNSADVERKKIADKIAKDFTKNLINCTLQETIIDMLHERSKTRDLTEEEKNRFHT